MLHLDSQIPPDHPARAIWSYVQTLDLSALYARIKARGSHPGQPASDPAVILAVWLHATAEGEGSARAIARLCEWHSAYRWLCGGVAINHDMLSAFRREDASLLDDILTQTLTGLVAEGLLKLEEVAIDGTKVRARAGKGSLAGRDRFERIEAEVKQRVARLKTILDEDADSAEAKRRSRTLKAAQGHAVRIQRARERLAQYEAEKAGRVKRDKRAAKTEAKVSVSDPEARQMRMPDDSVHLGWNVQVATAKGFIVAIDPTDRRNDTGLALDTLGQIRQRLGGTPKRLLADARAITLDEIGSLGATHPELLVYSPLPKAREDITPGGRRNRNSQLRHEPEAVRKWRERMAEEAAKAIYRRRKLTEHPHAKIKNRGFGQMPVHGRKAVRFVCLLHAITHNVTHAGGVRRRAGRRPGKNGT
jgi:transposase